MVKAGDYDGARAMHDKLPHTPVDEIFLEAQIFTAKGQLADAITAYRAILVARPELISARLLLADLLFAIGDWDAARFHFRGYRHESMRRHNPSLRLHNFYLYFLI